MAEGTKIPIYSYTCEDCGAGKDEYRKVDERNNCPSCDLCKKSMIKIISGYAVHGDIDYYDDNLQTRVRSRQHRRQLMKEQGVSEKFGSNWHTGASAKRP